MPPIMSIQQRRALQRLRQLQRLRRRQREQQRRRRQQQQQNKRFTRDIGGRSAFLVGINYIGTPYRLNGCINDIENMHTFLTSRSFSESNIKMLSDAGTEKPTKTAILTGLAELLQNSQPRDLLFFHYSGHGGQMRDQVTVAEGRDEADGKDECLFSSDLEPIRDDDLKNTIQHNIKANTTLVCLIDACNSATALDLRFNYSHNRRNMTKPRRQMRDSITRGRTIMISGCKDNQTSADAYIGGEFVGAMTTSFLKTFEPRATWLEMLGRMQQWLKKHRYSQIPQLASGQILQVRFRNEL